MNNIKLYYFSNMKNIFICILFLVITLLFISKKFIILNIYDNNVLCFIYKHYNEVETEPGTIQAEYKSIYTIFPFNINTKFGDIYIGSLCNIELRGKDYDIYHIILFSSKNKFKYDLEIFKNKIENVSHLQIGQYGLSIDLMQEFIIDGSKESVCYLHYNEIDNIILFVTSEYKYIYITLEGEIIRKEIY